MAHVDRVKLYHSTIAGWDTFEKNGGFYGKITDMIYKWAILIHSRHGRFSTDYVGTLWFSASSLQWAHLT